MVDLIKGVTHSMNNVETLRAAIYGHLMEHGVEPKFVLLSSDVAQAIFKEVSNDSRYKSFITVGAGPQAPMYVDIGSGFMEIGQIVGVGRVELVVDALEFKVRRSN